MRFSIYFQAAAIVCACALPAFAQSSGTTSGPQAGSPTTLGTGGVTPTSPHQTGTVRNQGGASIQGEQRGQLGGTTETVKPGASDAGSGATPRR